MDDAMTCDLCGGTGTVIILAGREDEYEERCPCQLDRDL